MIGHLLDHTVSGWRPTQSAGHLGQPVQSWTQVVVPIGLNAAVQNRSGDVRQLRAGEFTEGLTMVYTVAALPWQIGDIVWVEQGPEAGRLLRIEECYRPRGNHWQLRCENWRGEIPSALPVVAS